jgi:site-specific DNA-cytosine methylase
MPHDSFRALSLFYGAGVLNWRLFREGFKNVHACENSPAAVNCYNLSAKLRIIRTAHYLEINATDQRKLISETLDGEPICVVVGRLPCQGFHAQYSLTGNFGQQITLPPVAQVLAHTANCALQKEGRP